MINQKKCIGLGSLSIRNLNPFLAAICYVIRNYALILIDDHNSISLNWKHYPLFFTILMFSGEIIIGVLELFSIQWITKTPNLNPETDKMTKSLIPLLKPPQENKTWLYIFIFGLSIIEAVSFYGLNVLNNLFPNSNNLQIEIRGFKLIFDSILCHYVLNYRFFNHHYFAIGILILGITIMTAQEIVNEKNPIYLPFIFFGHSLLLSVRDCIEKALMDNKFISAIQILFFRGVFGFTVVSLITFILHFTPCAYEIAYLCEDFVKAVPSVFEGILPLYFGLYFFSGSLYNLFSTLTKQDFNPAYMAVADYFCAILSMIISVFVIGNKTRVWLIFVIVSYFLITIGCFLYNELIIFYCCNLHYNTKKEIINRSEINVIESTDPNLLFNN